MQLKRLFIVLSFLSMPLGAIAQTPFVIAPRDAIVSFTIGDLPEIVSPSSVGGGLGVAFNYQIAAVNDPTSYSANGRPAWLNFNPGTGLLYGTPTSSGVFSVDLTTTNAAGSYSKTITLNISGYVDSDSDGANDVWETTYFGSLAIVTATSINNLDGLLDRDEAILGLDPTKHNLTAAANKTSYTYNLRNELTKCTPAVGPVLNFSPDAEGNLK